MTAQSMREWPRAFRAYAEARWGDAWKDRAVDREALQASKLAFRAGFRAALREPAAGGVWQEPALVTRLRAHVRELDSLGRVPWVMGTMGRWVGSVVADLCEAADTLTERGARDASCPDDGGLWQGGREL